MVQVRRRKLAIVLAGLGVGYGLFEISPSLGARGWLEGPQARAQVPAEPSASASSGSLAKWPAPYHALKELKEQGGFTAIVCTSNANADSLRLRSSLIDQSQRQNLPAGVRLTELNLEQTPDKLQDLNVKIYPTIILYGRSAETQNLELIDAVIGPVDAAVVVHWLQKHADSKRSTDSGINQAGVGSSAIVPLKPAALRPQTKPGTPAPLPMPDLGSVGAPQPQPQPPAPSNTEPSAPPPATPDSSSPAPLETPTPTVPDPEPPQNNTPTPAAPPVRIVPTEENTLPKTQAAEPEQPTEQPNAAPPASEPPATRPEPALGPAPELPAPMLPATSADPAPSPRTAVEAGPRAGFGIDDPRYQTPPHLVGRSVAQQQQQQQLPTTTPELHRGPVVLPSQQSPSVPRAPFRFGFPKLKTKTTTAAVVAAPWQTVQASPQQQHAAAAAVSTPIRLPKHSGFLRHAEPPPSSAPQSVVLRSPESPMISAQTVYVFTPEPRVPVQNQAQPSAVACLPLSTPIVCDDPKSLIVRAPIFCQPLAAAPQVQTQPQVQIPSPSPQASASQLFLLNPGAEHTPAPAPTPAPIPARPASVPAIAAGHAKNWVLTPLAKSKTQIQQAKSKFFKQSQPASPSEQTLFPFNP